MPQWNVDFDCRVDLQDLEIATSVFKVDALAKVIHGVPLPPAVQMHIDSLNILRAVRGTTGIEGTEVSEDEVRQIMVAAPEEHVLSESRQRAEQEVRNAEKVLRYVAKVLTDNPSEPVTENLICKMHELTTKGIDYPANEPGVYRSHAVHVATYVPPRTGEEVRDLMDRFVRWFNDGPPKHWPHAVRAIAAHFYLISIHPFGDGNGRTARGLESFLLYQGGINARGFYSLSNFYYQHRPEYVAMLDHVRFETDRDLTPFVRFALKGLVAEQEAVHQEILSEVTIIAFRDFARASLEGKLTTSSGERMFHFLLGLPRHPVSIAELRTGGHRLSKYYHGLTSRTISRDLNYLKSKGLIRVEGDVVRANLEVMERFK